MFAVIVWPPTNFKGGFMAVALLLAACGGTEPADSLASGAQARSAPANQVSNEDSNPSAATSSSRPDAQLTAQALAQAEARAQQADASLPLESLPPGSIAAKEIYTLGGVARKASAVRIPVYRFYNGSTGAHFFTTSTTERDNVVANLSPPFSLEGPAFSVASDFSPGLSPVHRFYNNRSGVHFYTISEAERAHVVATLPHFTYEGVAYQASQVAGQGLVAFHRFYVPSKGFHFYTASESEKASIQANLSATYSYEGVGYHVLDADWRAEKLPHTGITTSQCFKAGSNELVTCTPRGIDVILGVSSVDLYAQQDGHRTAVNPMSYSEVTDPAGGTFPRSSCVRDNLTGLIWEGKTPTGERAGSLEYTHYNDGTSGDASAYVARINQLALCGFTDWRMPKRNELETIYDYSKTTGPMVNTTWFPNTASSLYWAAEGLRGFSSSAWYLPFDSHNYISFSAPRYFPMKVRLVRGSSVAGHRFSYSSATYGSDAANNVVNDAWTGLQWRRCLQGQTWNGTTCSAAAQTYTHEQALAHSKSQTGWRMPNIRELSSLANVDPAQAVPIDSVAFPANPSIVWATTPEVGFSSAWRVGFENYGQRILDNRSLLYSVRLLRMN